MTTLASCDSDPTVQSYYVDSEEKPGFYKQTVPKTILGIDERKLDEESLQAYNSLDKVSVLLLPAKPGEENRIKEEVEVFDKIISNGDYKTLITYNSDGMKVNLVYEGSSEKIDEIIAYGRYEDKVMGVARILGDDMNLGSIAKMFNELDGSDINPAGIKSILGGMGVDLEKEMQRDSIYSE
ncbi:hypothetical protein BST97_04295 [Nonlabens spongiae]|uniref:DUF4252 domain-containing protein n=2 Tax=Nonlabens spongiae TaxID=331648 RepID=A0A1W6MI48_9FLAO|nr:hypothetical protein BST97_04295 [Nonlabens spongiae]